MMLSQQSFPFTTAKYLNKVFIDDSTTTGRRSSIFSSENKEQDFFEKNDGRFIV